MAVMIPEVPREYDPLSLEGDMFKALNGLPDDYYVIHSRMYSLRIMYCMKARRILLFSIRITALYALRPRRDRLSIKPDVGNTHLTE